MISPDETAGESESDSSLSTKVAKPSSATSTGGTSDGASRRTASKSWTDGVTTMATTPTRAAATRGAPRHRFDGPDGAAGSFRDSSLRLTAAVGCYGGDLAEAISRNRVDFGSISDRPDQFPEYSQKFGSYRGRTPT